jgi:putative endonuclease
MEFSVYVIRSSEGFRYIGSTSDLDIRLTDHNSGRNHATKHGTNWVCLHEERFLTRGEAVKREKWLKTGAGRDWLAANVAGWSRSGAEARRGESAAAE